MTKADNEFKMRGIYPKLVSLKDFLRPDNKLIYKPLWENLLQE
jgi:hypothetical protein